MNTIETVTVELNNPIESRSYPIYIGKDLLARGDLLAPHFPAGRAAIVTNTTVAPLYLQILQATLTDRGIKSFAIILPDGEQYKTRIRSKQFLLRYLNIAVNAKLL